MLILRMKLIFILFKPDAKKIMVFFLTFKLKLKPDLSFSCNKRQK